MIATARYSLSLLVPPTAEPVSVAEFKQHHRINDSEADTTIAAYITAARQYVETFTRRQLVKATWKMTLDGWGSIEIPRSPLISISSIAYLDSAGASQALASTIYDVDTGSEPGRLWLGYGDSWPSVYGVPNQVTVTFVAGYGARTKTILTLASVLAGQTIVINGITFTAHATVTTAVNREFSISGTNAADATELSALINNETYGVSNVAAAVSGAVITLTPQPGTDITATPSASTIAVATSYECTTAESIVAVPQTLKHAIRMLCSHWWEHREAVSEAMFNEVPMAVERLLWSERVLEA